MQAAAGCAASPAASRAPLHEQQEAPRAACQWRMTNGVGQLSATWDDADPRNHLCTAYLQQHQNRPESGMEHKVIVQRESGIADFYPR